MKQAHCIAAFVLFCMLFSCETEKTNEHFSGTVKHFYTKKPISGITVELTRVTRVSWPVVSVNGKTFHAITDAQGKFEMDAPPLDKDEHYTLKTYLALEDTNDIGWKFTSNEIAINYGETVPELKLDAFPNGIVTLFISDSTWSKLPVDTVCLITPYDSVSLTRSFSSFKCWTEAAQKNKFRWYYTNKRKRIEKQEEVFVPQHTQPLRLGYNTDFSYELKF
jgi:hypothetical protein